MKTTQAKTSFNAGEVTPLLYGRADVEKYQNGCKELLNFIPSVQGPITRRPGTLAVAATKNNTPVAMIPFQFSTKQSYMLELGANYMRFYTQGGQIQSSGSPLEIATPWGLSDIFVDPVMTGSGTYDLRVKLDYVQSGDVLYLVHPDFPPYKLQRFSNTNWVLSQITFTKGPFKAQNSDTGVTVYASATTGTVTLTASSGIFTSAMVGEIFRLEPADLSQIKTWTAGQEIAHFGDTTTGIRRRSDGKTYVSATSITITSGKSLQTGGVMPIHVYGTQNDGSGLYVQGTVVQQQGVDWTFTDFGWGYVKITGYTDSTHVTATVVQQLPAEVVGSGNATFRWSKAAFNSVDGYPQAVTFFRERLVFGRGIQLYFSVAGDFENFSALDNSGNTTSAQAIQATLSSDQVNVIQWLAPQRDLIIGTSGAEFVASENTTTDPFGPGNVKVEQHTTDGSRAYVKPLRIGTSTIFVQGNGKLKELSYAIQASSYRTTDLSVLGDHLRQMQVVDHITWDKSQQIIWASGGGSPTAASGWGNDFYKNRYFFGFTYNTEQNVLGWHRHQLASEAHYKAAFQRNNPGVNFDPGTYSILVSGDTTWICGGVGNQVAIGYFDNTGQVYLDWAQPITSGYANGTVTLNDNLSFLWNSGTFFNYTTFPDSSVLNSILGFARYEDFSNWYQKKTPARFSCIPTSYSTNAFAQYSSAYFQNVFDGGIGPNWIGFKYTSQVTPLQLEGGAGDGTSQNKLRRTARVGIRVYDTAVLEWRGTGSPDSQWQTLEFLARRMGYGVNSQQLPNSGPRAFTGVAQVDWEGNYTLDETISIRQTEPLPLTILAITPQFTVYDR